MDASSCLCFLPSRQGLFPTTAERFASPLLQTDPLRWLLPRRTYLLCSLTCPYRCWASHIRSCNTSRIPPLRNTIRLSHAARLGAPSFLLSCALGCGSPAPPWTYTISPPSHPEIPSSATPTTESQMGSAAPAAASLRSQRFTPYRTTT